MAGESRQDFHEHRRWSVPTLGHDAPDETQLGGSIEVMPDGRVPATHSSRDASDLARTTDLLAAVHERRCGQLDEQPGSMDQVDGLA